MSFLYEFEFAPDVIWVVFTLCLSIFCFWKFVTSEPLKSEIPADESASTTVAVQLDGIGG